MWSSGFLATSCERHPVRVQTRWPPTQHRRPCPANPDRARHPTAGCPRPPRAFAATTHAAVGVIAELNRQISDLAEHFETHPDAEIYRSLPGLGAVLGARVLSEFGDDPNTYTDAKSRRNYAGTYASHGGIGQEACRVGPPTFVTVASMTPSTNGPPLRDLHQSRRTGFL